MDIYDFIFTVLISVSLTVLIISFKTDQLEKRIKELENKNS
jgi:hypothetical protein